MTDPTPFTPRVMRNELGEYEASVWDGTQWRSAFKDTPSGGIKYGFSSERTARKLAIRVAKKLRKEHEQRKQAGETWRGAPE